MCHIIMWDPVMRHIIIMWHQVTCHISQLLMSLPSVKVISDYKTLLRYVNLSAILYVHISLNISTSLRNFISFTSQSFPSSAFISSWIAYFFFCPSIGETPWGNVWLSVSSFYMLHSCMVVADHFLTSNILVLV